MSTQWTELEKTSNKVTSFSNTPSDDKYPSEKLVKTTTDKLTTDINKVKNDVSEGNITAGQANKANMLNGTPININVNGDGEFATADILEDQTMYSVFCNASFGVPPMYIGNIIYSTEVNCMVRSPYDNDSVLIMILNGSAGVIATSNGEDEVPLANAYLTFIPIYKI